MPRPSFAWAGINDTSPNNSPKNALTPVTFSFPSQRVHRLRRSTLGSAHGRWPISPPATDENRPASEAVGTFETHAIVVIADCAASTTPRSGVRTSPMHFPGPILLYRLNQSQAPSSSSPHLHGISRSRRTINSGAVLEIPPPKAIKVQKDAPLPSPEKLPYFQCIRID